MTSDNKMYRLRVHFIALQRFATVSSQFTNMADIRVDATETARLPYYYSAKS